MKNLEQLKNLTSNEAPTSSAMLAQLGKFKQHLIASKIASQLDYREQPNLPCVSNALAAPLSIVVSLTHSHTYIQTYIYVYDKRGLLSRGYTRQFCQANCLPAANRNRYLPLCQHSPTIRYRALWWSDVGIKWKRYIFDVYHVSLMTGKVKSLKARGGDFVWKTAKCAISGILGAR